MELCFLVTLVCPVGFIFGFFLLVALTQPPPNTPGGRTFYLVTALFGLLLAFLLGSYWFEQALRARPGALASTDYVALLWEKSRVGFLVGLGYVSLALVVKAALGRPYREEEEGEPDA